jgi:hypothetical protein
MKGLNQITLSRVQLQLGALRVNYLWTLVANIDSAILLRFYKVLQLPKGKENVIAEKSDNPTRYVMNVWIDRDGKQATVKKLLEALNECEQGGLAHTIEKMLGVELKLGCDVVDAVRNMHVEEPKRSKHCSTFVLIDLAATAWL